MANGDNRLMVLLFTQVLDQHISGGNMKVDPGPWGVRDNKRNGQQILVTIQSDYYVVPSDNGAATSTQDSGIVEFYC